MMHGNMKLKKYMMLSSVAARSACEFTIDALVASSDQACLSTALLSLERAAAIGNMGRVGVVLASSSLKQWI